MATFYIANPARKHCCLKLFPSHLERFKMRLIVLLCLPLCALAVTELAKEWDFLLFAQFWPSSSCIYFEHSGCVVPEQVNGWTIHGLWPSIPGSSSQPEFCNNSMKFDEKQIEVLRPQLNVQWPYYNKSGDPTELWEHEWDKHGTCAYSLPILKGELKYFNQTLGVHSGINLLEILQKANIVPSTSDTYLPQDIYNAVYSGVQLIPNIVCMYNKEDKQHYLSEIWLCLNKDLTGRNCTEANTTEQHLMRKLGSSHKVLKFKPERQSGSHPTADVTSYFKDCPNNTGVYYTPIPRN
ncbi:ribonuclease Oy-like isoform X2 [Physella acuta]|uniref:ribonuclease Oy-like isoform X2 n=1 Tax=Physella acuta TaxID=109671 RepID=UPI0027DD1426|nr:ribonuclease Oy-like isoform X2 [Physella acuta]